MLRIICVSVVLLAMSCRFSDKGGTEDESSDATEVKNVIVPSGNIPVEIFMDNVQVIGRAKSQGDHHIKNQHEENTFFLIKIDYFKLKNKRLVVSIAKKLGSGDNYECITKYSISNFDFSRGETYAEVMLREVSPSQGDHHAKNQHGKTLTIDFGTFARDYEKDRPVRSGEILHHYGNFIKLSIDGLEYTRKTASYDSKEYRKNYQRDRLRRFFRENKTDPTKDNYCDW